MLIDNRIAPEGEEAKEESCHYIYLCKKRPEAEEISKNWEKVRQELLKAEEQEQK